MKILEPTGIRVLSEEGKHLPFEERVNWSQLWIVDPLDGTKEFIKRNGEFTVNIALVENGRPIMGVVYVPVTGELYMGTKRQGAVKLIIDSEAELSRAFESRKVDSYKNGASVHSSWVKKSHERGNRRFLKTYREEHGEVAILSKGSSLKMCMVAEGLADVYPRVCQLWNGIQLQGRL